MLDRCKLVGMCNSVSSPRFAYLRWVDSRRLIVSFTRRLESSPLAKFKVWMSFPSILVFIFIWGWIWWYGLTSFLVPSSTLCLITDSWTSISLFGFTNTLTDCLCVIYGFSYDYLTFTSLKLKYPPSMVSSNRPYKLSCLLGEPWLLLLPPCLHRILSSQLFACCICIFHSSWFFFCVWITWSFSP